MSATKGVEMTKRFLAICSITLTAACSGGGDEAQFRIENQTFNTTPYENGFANFTLAIDGVEQVNLNDSTCQSADDWIGYFSDAIEPGVHEITLSDCDYGSTFTSMVYDFTPGRHLLLFTGDNLAFSFRLMGMRERAPSVPPEGQTWVRLAHAAPNVGAVDLYILNGDQGLGVATGISFGEDSGFELVPAAGTEVIAMEAGSTTEIARSEVRWSPWPGAENGYPMPFTVILNERCNQFGCVPTPRLTVIYNCIDAICSDEE
jgi:hypothetical protein